MFAADATRRHHLKSGKQVIMRHTCNTSISIYIDLLNYLDDYIDAEVMLSRKDSRSASLR